MPGAAPAAARAALTAALREHGATVAHYGGLALLDERPGLSSADLARQAFVTPQSLNQVLRELELEEKDWVARRPRTVPARLDRPFPQIGLTASVRGNYTGRGDLHGR